MAQDEPRTLLESEMARLGLSIRGLAKRLAESDDPRQVEQQRTNVKRWLDPARGVSEDSSARLAALFEQRPDYFVRASRPRVRQSVRLEELAAKLAEVLDAHASLQQEFAEIKAQFEQLETARKPQQAASTRQKPA